jgi:hypothetical protein
MIYADPNTGNVREDLQAPLAPHTQFFATPAEYHAWQVANFPPPPEVPVAPQVPVEVSNQQLRLALIEWGIMPSAILSQLQAMPAGADKEKALAAWEYANTFRRDHHLVGSLAAQIGLTAAQVDQLFILAETLG